MINNLEILNKKRGRPFQGTRHPTFSLRIDPKIFANIDTLVQSGVYSSRSEFILKAIEEKLTK
jgi:hypothetical protein